MNENKIRAYISSEDESVLERSIGIAMDQAALERERARRAENRATTVLAATGVLAGFLTHFGVTSHTNGSPDVLIIPLLLATCLLLVKASYYAVGTLSTLKGYELTPGFPLEVQQKSKLEGLKEELVWRVWECHQLQLVSIDRLFLLSRAQRSFVWGLVGFMGLGACDLLSEFVTIPVNAFAIDLAVLIVLIVVFAMDGLVERLGNFWTKPVKSPRSAADATGADQALAECQSDDSC